ncbi:MULTISPECIES: peptide chain release factor N(5)-glutamine methyltransferase [unclassified Butyrivibrio]|uniref:peptide chain release factor N(5)-glutamine methyltransferase n=1 Tax=unclassified Butyrivibrio TaxID=2639466 RepID=UPI0004193921|nr:MULTISPECIES: peptide chain release factor N(5)-glutamine methyltransferase [unclassified Butyrivibrio]SEL46211.1 release factor glutamine methyltransferase [Butyrivibrio sp. ob235]
MDYASLYKEGEEKLNNAGVPESALDARLLLEYVCGTDHNTLLSHGDMEVSEENILRYRDFLSKREQRIPVAYIVGNAEFMGIEFDVTGDVLIPNQDTETLAEEALRYLHDGMNVLDLCTGSGCIALSILKYSNDTKAVGTDMSDAALLIAEKNAEKLGLSDRFKAVKADIFPEQVEKYDLIVSNPPYIPTDVIETLAPEVKTYEPYMALDGSADGLSFYKRIVPGAKEYLFKNGYLLLEIGYDQGEAVKELMESNGYKDVQVIKDLGGNDRVVSGCFY